MSFIVERNQKIGLVGHNGAGKSTLLKLLARVIKPTTGRIENGPNVDVAYYSQNQLEILKKDEESLGIIFTYFMLETILLGKLMKLNPFDQPAVESIKQETKRALS